MEQQPGLKEASIPKPFLEYDPFEERRVSTFQSPDDALEASAECVSEERSKRWKRGERNGLIANWQTPLADPRGGRARPA
jgi:hypothetical protein